MSAVEKLKETVGMSSGTTSGKEGGDIGSENGDALIPRSHSKSRKSPSLAIGPRVIISE